MPTSLIRRHASPLSRLLAFTALAPGLGHVRSRRSEQRLSHAKRTLSTPHSVFIGSEGLWAWDPSDPFAPAAEFASLQEWIVMHAGADLNLWVSSRHVKVVGQSAGPTALDEESRRSEARRELQERHGDAASGWALAPWASDAGHGVCALSGIDLGTLKELARPHQVGVLSVAPWWYHAFLEARRCVHAMNGAAWAELCIVEGQNAVWLETARGRLARVEPRSLTEASIEALHEELRCRRENDDDRRGLPLVVVGHGLKGGDRAGELPAYVLGRLDGCQPPQWLRPTLRAETH